jgi:hypothetical protein
MHSLLTRPFSQTDTRPRLVRLKTAGKRRLVIASDRLHVQGIHYDGKRVVPCEGGPPHCRLCPVARLAEYAYFYAYVKSTSLEGPRTDAEYVEPAGSWVVHEITKSAGEDILRIAEGLGLGTLRGLMVDITRTKGGQFGRQRAHAVPYLTQDVVDDRVVIPDIQYLLTNLYRAKDRLRQAAS